MVYDIVNSVRPPQVLYFALRKTHFEFISPQIHFQIE